ncbi:TetR/AcrR family transcriptional regulator [Paenibacillus sonchi]|uniref:TetR/AcrR family transcriptional regulator n=1 Tax=Paenibacillus sonchi TaxID=373687 RepID=A0A974P795_9BACL|nr:TetR/AcrR family transcriptional regulator [Paenibacillus sonchi]MCE3199711.1 TetR/AcrR family transcriptional regulator [Paenibacillus sonchi]QQZ58665.1 TetR/AcrR family transcriptional regulator [Paenibacillus sonchi]
MNGFEKRAALIKSKIMKTTMELLKTWEIKKLRIADIAKAAGVSQVTIYNYFGSKEALISESFKDFVEESLLEFEEEMRQQKTLKERITYFIFKDKETYSTLDPALVKEIMFDDQAMYQYIQQQYDDRVTPLMVQMVEEGKASGEISQKVSVEAVLVMIQMYIKSSGEMLDSVAKHADKGNFLDELFHIFFYGLCGWGPEE